MNVLRLPIPAESSEFGGGPSVPGAADAEVNPDLQCERFGGQRDWNWTTPWLFHALESAQPVYMPALPTPGREHPDPAMLGYWNALVHLLRYRLAWNAPARGLRWWFENGKPTYKSREFALMKGVWDSDGTLDGFVAWAHTHSLSNWVTTWVLCPPSGRSSSARIWRRRHRVWSRAGTILRTGSTRPVH